MKVKVNGRVVETAEKTNLWDFVLSCKIKAEEAVVVLNETVVKRDQWGSTVLADGDSLELVSLIGGG